MNASLDSTTAWRAESIGLPISTQPQLTKLVADCRTALSDTSYFEIERSMLVGHLCYSNPAIRRMTVARGIREWRLAGETAGFSRMVIVSSLSMALPSTNERVLPESAIYLVVPGGLNRLPTASLSSDHQHQPKEGSHVGFVADRSHPKVV